jgi:hypothetical protein
VARQRAVPRQKLIVWLATIHAARNIQPVESDEVDYSNVFPTGPNSGRRSGRRCIAWQVALEVESGIGDEPWPIVADQRPELELEEMFGQAGFDAAVLDFRSVPAGGEWLRGPLVSRPFGNGARLAPSWPDVRVVTAVAQRRRQCSEP